MKLPRFAAVLLGLAWLFAVPALARASGVQVAVRPETLTVAPGDTFTVTLDVTAAGGAFNGVDATLGFDPGMLTLLPGAQPTQEGPLLSAYCGNTFYLFSAAGDSLHFSDTMLCAGGSVTGPGTLLKVRFVAAALPGVTRVRLRRAVFYDDGLYVNPVVRTDALIAVGITLAVPPPPPGPHSARILASPNPARGPCRLRLDGVLPGPRSVLVLDAAGRIVRRLDTLVTLSGAELVWDRRDGAGRAAPPGVYRAILRGDPAGPRTSFVLLP